MDGIKVSVDWMRTEDFVEFDNYLELFSSANPRGDVFLSRVTGMGMISMWGSGYKTTVMMSVEASHFEILKDMLMNKEIRVEGISQLSDAILQGFVSNVERKNPRDTDSYGRPIYSGPISVNIEISYHAAGKDRISWTQDRYNDSFVHRTTMARVHVFKGITGQWCYYIVFDDGASRATKTFPVMLENTLSRDRAMSLAILDLHGKSLGQDDYQHIVRRSFSDLDARMDNIPQVFKWLNFNSIKYVYEDHAGIAFVKVGPGGNVFYETKKHDEEEWPSPIYIDTKGGDRTVNEMVEEAMDKAIKVLYGVSVKFNAIHTIEEGVVDPDDISDVHLVVRTWSKVGDGSYVYKDGDEKAVVLRYYDKWWVVGSPMDERYDNYDDAMTAAIIEFEGMDTDDGVRRSFCHVIHTLKEPCNND